jgi:maltose O-acetyltransferase
MQEQPKTEKEKMLSNELYLASDPELAAESWQAFHLTRPYNGVAAEDLE